MEPDPQSPFSDIDLLTGCWNLVRFTKGIQDNFGNADLSPMTLIGIDVHQLRRVNRVYGIERGDQLLRWLGIALRDEMGNTVYRISGDAFVVAIIGGTTVANNGRARNLFGRLNDQARQLSMEIPVVRMAVIHFSAGSALSNALVWKNLNELMELINGTEPFKTFEAESLGDNPAMVRAIELMSERILSLAYMLNVTFRLAYTDPVGNLPNLIATRRKLDLIAAEAASKGQRFSMILIDGDDLKRYNAISYATGDRLINQLSAVLMATVRSGDFVGRWRFGDEFIVILEDVRSSTAVALADEIGSAIEEASQSWTFPITVSAGVVEYPAHGSTVDELISKAEKALKAAKAAGKNRTIVAE
ncbi:MAG: GGDEF domain-containing protein [Chloroflexota bacterium]